MTDLLVRPATLADAAGIAEVHVRSWQAAYRGLMPEEVLDGLSVPARTQGWQRILSESNPPSRTLVAVSAERVLGWASFGAARDVDAAASGELWGLYAHPDAWSTGVGHALLDAVEHTLRGSGHASAYLWVLAGNDRAATFYERHGWAADGASKVEHRPELDLHELRHVKARL